MLLKLPLKKLVVELRYKPHLVFYDRMDSVGLDHAEEFPDWERSPLTLELRNKKKHRRLFLSNRRIFFEADDADADIDLGYAERLFRKVCPKLDLKTMDRIGIRQWFVADIGKPFALMVDEIAQRFLAHDETLNGILGDKTKDVAYVVDCETADGLRYNLRLGPMMKSQWFLTVGHEPNIFERVEDRLKSLNEKRDEESKTLEKFVQSFPEQFLFVDIDCYREEQQVEKLEKIVASVRRRTHDLASKLIEFCKK